MLSANIDDWVDVSDRRAVVRSGLRVFGRGEAGVEEKVGDLYGRYDQGTVEPSAVIVPEDAVLSDIDLTVHTVW